MNRLRKEYNEKTKAELQKELNLDNSMAVPTFAKIVINAGVGEATDNSGAIDEVVENLTLISGQKPVINKARKAISQFKVRQGQDIGVSVTLRGDRMWDFFDKLVTVVLPRIKDFRGVKATAFDGSGNYSLGIEEHTVFPEIDPNKAQKIRPLQITIVTNTDNDEHAKALLNKFKFPFRK